MTITRSRQAQIIDLFVRDSQHAHLYSKLDLSIGEIQVLVDDIVSRSDEIRKLIGTRHHDVCVYLIARAIDERLKATGLPVLYDHLARLAALTRAGKRALKDVAH